MSRDEDKESTRETGLSSTKNRTKILRYFDSSAENKAAPVFDLRNKAKRAGEKDFDWTESPQSGLEKWHPHRDSNPGYQDENLMS